MKREELIRVLDIISNLYKDRVEFKNFQAKQPQNYKLLIENQKYRNKHKGKRCFILGNAPSLNKIDFMLLKNEYTFTVNELFRHPLFEQLQSNYHFIVDPYYFQTKRKSNAEIEMLNVLKEKGAKKNAPQFFFPLEGHDYIKKNKIDKILKCNYFCSRLYFHKKYTNIINFSRFIPTFQAVVQFAIAMAVYMGFSEIYLLGCDATNVITDLSSFQGATWKEKYAYELDDESEESQKKPFLEYGFTTILNGYNRIFELFKEINLYCKKMNVKLYNCSEITLIESIPRKPFDDVIRSKIKQY